MNEKITANLSLTKEKWGLLVLMVLSSAPHLPNTLWELTWELRDDIEKALEHSTSEEKYEIEEARRHFKRVIELDEEENNESS